MKGFARKLPELGFMVLVLALPLVVGFLWRSETFGGFLGKVGVGMLVGLGMWLTLVFAGCRQYDRKKRGKNAQA